MDKLASSELIKKTFSFPFNEENFSNFSHNIFDNINLNNSSNWISNSALPNNLKQFVAQYKVLGTYKDKNNGLIIITMVKFLDKNIVEKSRYIQREFSKWLLNNFNADSCLIPFFSDDYEDWRFSFVTLNYTREKTKSGKIKVTENLSPLKRYSYLVGKNEPNHTAQVQLAPLLFDENKNPSIEQLIKAFSVEKVNKEFFENYRNLSFELEKEIITLRKKDKILNLNLKENNINNLEFAKKIMGQIVFIYFLQKKRFIGHKLIKGKFEKKSTQDFLMRLYNSNQTGDYAKYKNFFNDILEPLFYNGFAKKRENGLFKMLNCFVPFLSSELFEPINGYDWKNTEILLNNNIFKKIFEVFNRFNFTAREEEPLETEVAVDPEMLGKVLENLLPDKEKRLTGTFYTPRPVVDYMCNQAITSFLKIHFDKELSEEDFKNIILISNFEENPNFKKNFFSTNFYKIVDKIDEKLMNIYICDPAIGSGAFTVSIMNKIVKIRLFLNSFKNDKKNKYIFKRNFIENCMYGVDIEPSAIDTAKLRLYLSLIVDEEKLESLHQLPNLDFKIMQGNSLIDEFNGIKLDLTFSSNNLEIISNEHKIKEMITEIKKIKKNLIYIQDYEIKKIKKKDINKLIYNILKIKIQSVKNFNSSIKDTVIEVINPKTKKNFFAWRIFFSEVFTNKGGFDIVIANPPYKSYGLRGVASLEKEEKQILKKIYPNSAEYKISFYALFMDLCLQLTNSKGTKILIIPDSFLLGIYFSKIRLLLLKNTNIDFISFFTYKVFEADVGYSVVYMAYKNDDISKNITANLVNSELDLINHSFKSFSYSTSLFESLNHKKFRLFFDIETFKLIEKIEKNNIPLIKYLTGHTGIRSKIGKDDIISKLKKNRFYKKGIVSSAEISKFNITHNGYWISTDPNILWSGGFDKRVIEVDKILMRQTGDSVIAAIDKDRLYHLNNTHSFSHKNNDINIECLLGFLNSKLFKFYYQNISLEKKRVMAQIDIENIESLKIKSFESQLQKETKDLVNKIQILYKKNDANEEKITELLNLLDKKFYDSYNLTPREINLVEDFIEN